MKCYLVCVLACAIVIGACGKKNVVVNAPAPVMKTRPLEPAAPAPPIGTAERGLASWYGHPYHGRPAADGEIYDMEQLVAAHRTLPFQTIVRVRNLSNGKTVDVRIIDRGPFVQGRIIDLSHAAAREIELIGPGVAQVEVTIIGTPGPRTRAVRRPDRGVPRKSQRRPRPAEYERRIWRRQSRTSRR
jgi:rare lipoprotein A